jgi:predicted nucleic acid-binding protein
MNVLDSSGWIEFLNEGANYEKFAVCAEDLEHLLVPSIVIYEVVKFTTVFGDDEELRRCLKTLQQTTVVSLTDEIAYSAVEVSRRYNLALADSIIYTTAMKLNATLWTQDKHFKDIEGVKYFSKS